MSYRPRYIVIKRKDESPRFFESQTEACEALGIEQSKLSTWARGHSRPRPAQGIEFVQNVTGTYMYVEELTRPSRGSTAAGPRKGLIPAVFVPEEGPDRARDGRKRTVPITARKPGEGFAPAKRVRVRFTDGSVAVYRSLSSGDRDLGFQKGTLSNVLAKKRVPPSTVALVEVVAD